MERAHRRKRRFRFGLEGVMCFVGAVFLALVGVVMVLDTYWLDQRGVVVTAMVLDEHEGKTSRIEVRYVTAAGETIENETANYDQAEVGQEIQVVYDPEEPYRVQAADWGFSYWLDGLWFAGALLLVVGGVGSLWSAD